MQLDSCRTKNYPARPPKSPLPKLDIFCAAEGGLKEIRGAQIRDRNRERERESGELRRGRSKSLNRQVKQEDRKKVKQHTQRERQPCRIATFAHSMFHKQQQQLLQQLLLKITIIIIIVIVYIKFTANKTH